MMNLTDDPEISALRRRLRQLPDDRDARLSLCALLAERGEFRAAAKSLEELCTRVPHDGALRLEVARLWLRAGRPLDAARAARLSLAHGADAFAAQCLIAEAFEHADRPPQANAAYREGLRLRPDAAMLWNNLGLLLRAQGEENEARSAFEQALVSNPSYAVARSNLGNLYHACGEYEAALACYDEALASSPDAHDTRYNRGLVLLQLNQGQAAAECFNAVLTALPDHAGAAVQRIETAIALGRFADARQYADARIDAFPHDSRAWFLAAQITADPVRARGLLARIGELRGEPGFTPSQSADLNFAQARLCDLLGEYDAAFEAARRANRVQRECCPASRRRALAELGEALLAMRVPVRRDTDAARAVADPWLAPVFIVGMPRAGTTLLEQKLCRHPALQSAGEVDFFGPALRRAGTAASPREFAAAIATLGRGEAPEEEILLRAGYRRRLAALGISPKARAVDKTPFNLFYVGLLLRLFPAARFLYCTRHPLDTCLSLYFQQFGALDFACDLVNIAEVQEVAHALMRHWATCDSPILEIPYDRLVCDTDAVVADALKFVGETCEVPSIAGAEITATVNSASRWQARQPVYTHAIGRWQHYATYLAPVTDRLSRLLAN